jgi:3-phosphoshikimate 1-carboxyvinyltransferase
MTSMSFKGGKIDGRLSPPPSKSHTHRAVFLSSMARGRSVVTNALLSDDIRSTISACRAMGASCDVSGRTITVDGGDLHAPTDTVDAGNSGTTMRIYAGLCSMFDREVTITGDESLQKRPMGALLEALGRMGVKCCSRDGLPPVTVCGPNKGGKVSIDGHISSQYITSLMLVSPMLPEDTEITVEGTMVSAPYLDVTANMMRLYGAEAVRDGNVFRIRGGTGYRPHDYCVPSDFSSAAFPLVAGALGGRMTADNMDMTDPQGDKAIVDIIMKAGGEVTVSGSSITSERRELKGCDVDLGSIPDLFPITAVLLSTAEGESRLYGAPQLKFKESDRIRTVVDMINAIGGDATATDDGCIIHGRKRLSGGHIEHLGDHRIMMSAAIASIVCDGPVTMDDAECCAVSYPGFPEQMATAGLRSEVLRCSPSAAD